MKKVVLVAACLAALAVPAHAESDSALVQHNNTLDGNAGAAITATPQRWKPARSATFRPASCSPEATASSATSAISSAGKEGRPRVGPGAAKKRLATDETRAEKRPPSDRGPRQNDRSPTAVAQARHVAADLVSAPSREASGQGRLSPEISSSAAKFDRRSPGRVDPECCAQ